MKNPIRSKQQALSFPNESRSFDEKRARVCFWAYDSAIEISFYIEANTLKELSPKMDHTEPGILQAFDAVREQVHDIANKVYARGEKGTYAYTLLAEDL